MTTTDAGLSSLLDLDPDTYSRHPLHDSGRAYAETNCYTDILIEFVHALGHEPLAMMGCALEVDFEGDQWTFFKPRPEDLVRLYGIDVHEMQPYRPLPDQIAEQIESGRTLIVELDSWYLPDTASTSYRREHVKSSVVAGAIDRKAERLRYFHGGGYYELEGADYRGVFRLGHELSADVLPPYTELARLDAGTPLRGEELRAASRALLAETVARRPASNPFGRFGDQLGRDLERLLAGDIEQYHAYAFATVRMVGSAFEAGASHVDWALGEDGRGAVSPMGAIVDGCKALSFKLARRREFDPGPAIESLASSWDECFVELADALK